MIKIDEKVDLSNKVLEIDIESPIFKTMLNDLNMEIKRVIDKVYDEEFESGEITLKLSLTIPEAYKEYPAVNEFGDEVFETYRYKKPYFEHKVTTTLKKQYKQEGTYTEEREIVFENGQYKAIPLKDPQINMFEVIEEEEQYGSTNY